MQDRRPSLSRRIARPSPLTILLALAAAALLPPFGLVAMPDGWALLLMPRTGIVLVAALVVAPVLAVLAVALRGFGEVRARVTASLDGEHRQIVLRILVGSGLLAYLFGLASLIPAGEAILPSLITAALGIAAAWLFLVHGILSPAPSAVRRYLAIAADIGLLSALLHAGGGLTAAWYPLYICIAIGNGCDFGARPLVVAALLGVGGFAAVVATTPFWQDQPLLSQGLIAALAILPACVAALLRNVARAHARAEAARAAANCVVAALSDDLRLSLRAIMRAGSQIDPIGLAPDQGDALSRLRLSTRAALIQIDDFPTYIGIETGAFAPESRSFDLYQLIHGAVAALRPQAAERGIALTVRIDPRLPYELRGWAHQLRQIVVCLIVNALRHADRATVQVTLDLLALSADTAHLRISVRDHGNRVGRLPPHPVPEPDGEPRRHPGLAVAERLAALMGGALTIEGIPRKGLTLAIEVPVAIDRAALALLLDLAHLPALIVTDDTNLARELIDALAAWRADAQWIGAADDALAYITALDPAEPRPVLIVDGRGEVLPALSWAHRALKANPAAAPYILFVADEARIDSVIGLADGGLDAILPAPFTHGVLQSTLHALRVGAADWFPAEIPPVPVPVRMAMPPPLPTVAGDAAAIPPPAPRPRAAPAPPPPAAERLAGAASVTRQTRILVVATNAANRKIIEHILGSARYVAHPAADGEQALQALAEREFDAVLLDLAAPVSDAFELAESCLDACPGIPIIALSGDGDEAAELADIATILNKPVEPSRLLAAIAAALPAQPPGPAEAAIEPTPVPPTPAPTPAIITEISSHPRFGRTGASMIDERAVGALLSLGAGSCFFDDVVEAFRADSRLILKELGGAAAIGDAAGFAGSLQGLRNCTASFGGDGLRDLLRSMQELSASDLHQKGLGYVQQIGVELARLDAVLVEYQRSAR